jgi:hypothetical protein
MGVCVIETKTKTARKSHHCDYCGKIIEKGEEYSYQKTIFDSAFCEWRTHLACARVAAAIWDYVDPDDGMSEDEFRDGCQEIRQEFICPDCPKWNMEYGDCDDDLTYCIDKMDEVFETHELYKAGREAYCEIWKCRERKIDG